MSQARSRRTGRQLGSPPTQSPPGGQPRPANKCRSTATVTVLWVAEALGSWTKTTEPLPKSTPHLLPPTVPEFPMFNNGDQQPSTTPLSYTTSAWIHHMKPCPFSEKPGENVEERLGHCKHISKCNAWNTAAQIEHVALFLTDPALVWFENHKEPSTTWDHFATEITQCCEDSSMKRKRAEQTLLQLAQVPGETRTMCIETIFKLCRTVNPQMSEEDKNVHLLKGIAEEAAPRHAKVWKVSERRNGGKC